MNSSRILPHYTFDRAVEDCTRKILGEKEVAASPDWKERTRQRRIRNSFPQLIHMIIFNETAALHIHLEGVHAAKACIKANLHTFKYTKKKPAVKTAGLNNGLYWITARQVPGPEDRSEGLEDHPEGRKDSGPRHLAEPGTSSRMPC